MLEIGDIIALKDKNGNYENKYEITFMTYHYDWETHKKTNIPLIIYMKDEIGNDGCIIYSEAEIQIIEKAKKGDSTKGRKDTYEINEQRILDSGD